MISEPFGVSLSILPLYGGRFFMYNDFTMNKERGFGI
jgi:hypothetical protein